MKSEEGFLLFMFGCFSAKRRQQRAFRPNTQRGITRQPMNAKQNHFQNAFQNASQLQSFSYNEIGNQTSIWFALLLLLILFIALMRSEARTRALLEKLIQVSNQYLPTD
jgi:hypothetical protein